MRWWRQYCCCCWNADERLLNDSSSLMQQPRNFCIPSRRHSSFHTADEGTRHSSSSSSEEREEESSSTTTDRVSSKKSRSGSFSDVTSSSKYVQYSTTSSKRRGVVAAEKLYFDRHILTEIAESAEERLQAAADVCGHITFSTSYDELRLHVFVERASCLPRKGSQETYNTFVKMSILFSKNTSSSTSRTVKNTLSPVYREDHVFHTNRSKSTHQTCLKLSLFDCDRQGRHDAIGHALLPLSQLSGRKQKHSLSLTPMSIPTKKNLGQVLVGLSYLPSHSLLCIQLVKARHLAIDTDIHKLYKETLDTFVKVSLMCAGQKVKSNVSRVVFGTSDPFYHFKNTFVLPSQFMLDASVVVSVVVRGILGRSFTLGRVISGPYTEMSDGTPTHWGKMVQENRNIVQWRNLYL